jgi:hypothetical protein
VRFCAATKSSTSQFAQCRCFRRGPLIPKDLWSGTNWPYPRLGRRGSGVQIAPPRPIESIRYGHFQLPPNTRCSRFCSCWLPYSAPPGGSRRHPGECFQWAAVRAPAQKAGAWRRLRTQSAVSAANGERGTPIATRIAQTLPPQRIFLHSLRSSAQAACARFQSLSAVSKDTGRVRCPVFFALACAKSALTRVLWTSCHHTM